MKPCIVVIGIIINEDEKVLLTKRCDVPKWCIPGGYVEFGESIVQGLIRELKEEICVDAIVTDLIGIYSAPNIEILPPAKVPMIVFSFRCEIVSGKPGISEEVSEINFFDKNNLPDLVPRHEQRIIDAYNYDGKPLIK